MMWSLSRLRSWNIDESVVGTRKRILTRASMGLMIHRFARPGKIGKVSSHCFGCAMMLVHAKRLNACKNGVTEH